MAGATRECEFRFYEELGDFLPPQWRKCSLTHAFEGTPTVKGRIESLGKPSAPRDHLRAWLFTVARNAIYRTYGEPDQLPLDDVEEWMPAPPEDSNPEIRLSEVVDLDRVRRALRMLAAEHQEVLILRFGQRLSLQETADLMGKSVSAIKSLQFRAVDTLRGILLEAEVS